MRNDAINLICSDDSKSREFSLPYLNDSRHHSADVVHFVEVGRRISISPQLAIFARKGTRKFFLVMLLYTTPYPLTENITFIGYAHEPSERFVISTSRVVFELF